MLFNLTGACEVQVHHTMLPRCPQIHRRRAGVLSHESTKRLHLQSLPVYALGFHDLHLRRSVRCMTQGRPRTRNEGAHVEDWTIQAKLHAGVFVCREIRFVRRVA